MAASVVCAVFLRLLLQSAIASRAPDTMGQQSSPVTATLGRSAKLPCAVTPVTFIEWVRSGVAISEATSDVTIRTDGINSFMRINNVRPQDAGLYTCIAIWGFGSTSINVTLVVVDTNGYPFDVDLGPGDEAPSFTHPAEDFPSDATRLLAVGSALRLQCRAKGRPQPVVSWFFNGVRQPDGAAGSRRTADNSPLEYFAYNRPSMHLGDTGNYSCRAVNRAGSVQHTFLVDVAERGNARFGITTPYPQNITVLNGDAVTLQCDVRSLAMAPRVYWLKEQSIADVDIDKDDIVDAPLSGLALPVDTGVGSRLLPVKLAFMELAPAAHAGHYVAKLSIPAALAVHTGRYVCYATDYTYNVHRSVYLAVQPKTTNTVADQEASSTAWLSAVFGSYSATLAVVIAIPSVVLLLISATIIYAVNKRKREHRAAKARWRQQKLCTLQDTVRLPATAAGCVAARPATSSTAPLVVAVTESNLHPYHAAMATAAAASQQPPVRLAGSTMASYRGEGMHTAIPRQQQRDYDSSEDSQLSSPSTGSPYRVPPSQLLPVHWQRGTDHYFPGRPPHHYNGNS